MPFVVEFHRLARQDYDQSYDWYANRSPDTAQRFKEAVDDAVSRISTAALSLPLLSGPYRRVRVEHFPYIVVFRMRSTNDAVVVAVAHTSRRPGYWRRRS